MDVMALRSVTELPVTRRHVLDPEVLRTVAAVDRVGDLTRFNVAEVPELAQLSAPEELLAPDERGWALGHALSLAVEHGQRLWLSEVPTQRLGLLRSVLGERLVHVASPQAPDGVEAQRRGDVLFLLNHSDRACEVAGVVGTDLLSGQSCTGHVIVPPRSALVVHHPPNTQASSSSTTLT